MDEEEADKFLEELWVETESNAETDDGGRSLGFEIEQHGWSFVNYAADTGQQFSTADAIALFGAEAVCGSAEGSCTPTPAATEWINMVAQAMSGGVCEGMTVALLDRFLVRTEPLAFDIRRDRVVERSLSRLFATQFLGDVIDATAQWREQPIKAIVAELGRSLSDPRNEQYTIGIYSSHGGHSVLPYRLEWVDQTNVRVYIYDPNWPGELRWIDMDVKEGTWVFAFAATNPDEAADAWAGGQGTIDLTPISSRAAPFPEPFSGAGSGAGGLLLAITSPDRNWTITQADGTSLQGSEAVPGEGGVVASIRGSFGVSTSIIRVDASEIDIETDSEAFVAVQTETGVASVEMDAAGSVGFEISEETQDLALDVATGTDATVSIATATEHIVVEKAADLQIEVAVTNESTQLDYVDEAGSITQQVEVERGTEQQDVQIDTSFEVAFSAPIELPEQIRAEELELETETKDLFLDDFVQVVVSDEGDSFYDVLDRVDANELETWEFKAQVVDLGFENFDPNRDRTTEQTIAADFFGGNPVDQFVDPNGGCSRVVYANGTRGQLCPDGSGEWVDGRGGVQRWGPGRTPDPADLFSGMTSPDEGFGMGGPGEQFPDDMPEEMRDLRPTSFEFDEATGCESLTFEDGSTGTRCKNADGSFTNSFTGTDGEIQEWEEPGFVDPMMAPRGSPDEPMSARDAARFGNFEQGMGPGDFRDEMMPGGAELPDEMRGKIPAIVMFDPESGCEEVIFEDGTTSSRCMNQDGTFTNTFTDESGEVKEWEEEPPPMMQRRMPTDMDGGGMGGGMGGDMGGGMGGGGMMPDNVPEELRDLQPVEMEFDQETGCEIVTFEDGSSGTRCQNPDGSMTSTHVGLDGEVTEWEEPAMGQGGGMQGGGMQGGGMPDNVPAEVRNLRPVDVKLDQETGCEIFEYDDGSRGTRCQNPDGSATSTHVGLDGEVTEWEEPAMGQGGGMPGDGMQGGGMPGGDMGSFDPGADQPENLPDNLKDLEPVDFQRDPVTGCDIITLDDGTTVESCVNEDGSLSNTHIGTDGSVTEWDEPPPEGGAGGFQPDDPNQGGGNFQPGDGMGDGGGQGGFTPDPGGDQGGFTPDPGGDQGGFTPDPGGDQGGFTPDPGGDQGGFTPDPGGDQGGFTPDPGGDQGG
ncbi:MAG: proline-rich domain-containing protein, partial [Acidimicrobiales bacterium]|nr:proline-rich domain-containing protein [Acidimicrobiales bacterium]